MEGNSYTTISFQADEPNMDSIIKQWDDIVAIIFDLGQKAKPLRSLSRIISRTLRRKLNQYQTQIK